MRTLFYAVSFAALSISVAHADDVMASRYGNTTIVTDARGMQTKVYYKADGTLTGKQMGRAFTGTWKVEGGQVCLHTTPTMPDMQEPFCRAVSARKVGDEWQVGDRRVKLVQGIQ